MALHSKIRAGVVVGLSMVIGGTALADSITLAPNYTDGAGEGFNDPTFGTSRRAAFEYSLGIWGSILNTSYTGETITINAAFNPLGGSGTSAVLGSAGATNHFANFGSSNPEYQTQTFYGAPLRNHLQGTDGNGATNEISAQFNSDVDNSTVLGNTNWYYGTDQNVGIHIDFVTVALHEIGHGLNFTALVGSNGAPPLAGFWGIYDRFMEDLAGTDLTAMGSDAARAAALISTDLFWNGANGAAGNGGSRPELYAPNPYENGSSTSHLDEDGAFASELMSPFYSGPDHLVSDMERGMLDDMGWDVNLIPEPASLAALGLLGLALLRRRAA